MKIGDKVHITRNPECHSFSYENDFDFIGTIHHIDEQYKNEGAKEYGTETCYYIKFDEIDQYNHLLLRGSQLYVYYNDSLIKGHIYELNDDNIKFEEYSETITPYGIIYTIDKKDIDSMLIYHKAYCITKI